MALWHEPTGLPSTKALLPYLAGALAGADREGQRVALLAVRTTLPAETPSAPWLGLLRPRLRPSDYVAVAGDDVVVLVVPALSAEAADGLTGRFVELMQGSLGVTVRGTAIAWYPTDATGADELLARVGTGLEGLP